MPRGPKITKIPVLKNNMLNSAGKPSSCDVLSWQDVLHIGDTLPDTILQVQNQILQVQNQLY